MNSSQNNSKVEDGNASDAYYYSLDFILSNFGGSTWVLDNINVYLFMVTGLIRVILNLFRFFIFYNTNTPL
jgi:hypothetical protein